MKIKSKLYSNVVFIGKLSFADIKADKDMCLDTITILNYKIFSGSKPLQFCRKRFGSQSY